VVPALVEPVVVGSSVVVAPLLASPVESGVPMFFSSSWQAARVRAEASVAIKV